MSVVIKVENLTKTYQLGVIGQTTLQETLERKWAKLWGKSNSSLPIDGTNNHAWRQGDTIYALQDLNFEVKQGEVLGIIGKNGAGKSTLLKILSKITAPTSGTVKVKGRIASLLEVGTGMHPELTGRENIFLNGAILGMQRAEIRSKLDAIIDFAGIDDYIDTPIKRYSSGMRVRLGFAVAAFLEPEILIVDEVLAVGDAEFQKKAIGKMQDVAQGEGRTVLFVSHNMASISNLCTQAMLMEQGKIETIAEVDAIIDKYTEKNIERTNTILSERTDRSGNQWVKILKYSILDEHQNEINFINSGSKVFFRLDYESKRRFLFSQLKISLGIRNLQGVVLFTCPSWALSGNSNNHIKEKGSFFLKFDKFPLPEGAYTFNIYVEAMGSLSDWIVNAGYIDVAEGDFYGSGKNPPLSHRGVLVNYQWKLYEMDYS